MNSTIRRLALLPVPVVAAGLIIASLSLAPVQSAHAACTAFNISSTSTTATANICGVTVNATLTASSDDRVSGTINGIDVAVESVEAPLSDVTLTSLIKLFVNGSLEFNGRLGDLTEAELQRILGLLGGLQSTAIAQDTNRVGTTRAISVVSGRIGSVLRPSSRPGGVRTVNLDNGRDLKIRGLTLNDDGSTSDPMKGNWSTGTVGLAAGDGSGGSSAWGSVSNTWLSDDATLTRFDGRLTLFTVGYDRQLGNGWVAGVAGVLETSDIDTNFNDGETDTFGATVVPYFGKSLWDGKGSFDMQVGYGRLNTDTKRNRTAGQTNGDFDSYRLFGAANLAAYHDMGPWQFTGRVGALATHESSDDYVESNGTAVNDQNITLVQVSVGGEARYAFDGWSPFVGATYINDVKRGGVNATAKSRDDDEIQLEAGASIFHSNNLVGELTVTHSVGRSDIDETTLLGSLRYNF